MTTWNNTAPAVGNQITADIPDITENFAHLKSGFVRLFQDTWSDSDLTDDKIDTTVGFNDGTYNVEFPTNGIAAHSVIMLGNSSTIIWMYLNAAPPGWKVLTTGGDTVLAVSGGTGDYNVNGGLADTASSWQIDGFSHTHTGPSHTHTGTFTGYGTGSSAGGVQSGYLQTDNSGNTWHTTSAPATGAAGTGATAAGGANNDSTYRPKASVGKLYQLDTA